MGRWPGWGGWRHGGGSGENADSLRETDAQMARKIAKLKPVHLLLMGLAFLGVGAIVFVHALVTHRRAAESGASASPARRSPARWRRCRAGAARSSRSRPCWKSRPPGRDRRGDDLRPPAQPRPGPGPAPNRRPGEGLAIPWLRPADQTASHDIQRQRAQASIRRKGWRGLRSEPTPPKHLLRLRGAEGRKRSNHVRTCYPGTPKDPSQGHAARALRDLMLGYFRPILIICLLQFCSFCSLRGSVGMLRHSPYS